jgi:hypothetical protein
MGETQTDHKRIVCGTTKRNTAHHKVPTCCASSFGTMNRVIEVTAT